MIDFVSQTSVLEHLQIKNPDGRYWIKIDGTDIKVALQESKQREWNGDSELGVQSSVSSLKEEYNRRWADIFEDANLEEAITELNSDKEFLKAVMQSSGDEFNRLASKKKQKSLSWEIVEVVDLLQKAENIAQLLDEIKHKPQVHHRTVLIANKREISAYLRNLYKKRRTAATHVLVVMVADEQRNRKPYAVPIQYLPYHRIRDDDVRNIIEDVIVHMKQYNLQCIGESISDRGIYRINGNVNH